MPDTTLTANGQTYKLSDLSEAARQQYQNIAYVDSRLHRLQQESAVLQTARNAYLQSLIAELPKSADSISEKPRKVAPSRKKKAE